MIDTSKLLSATAAYNTAYKQATDAANAIALAPLGQPGSHPQAGGGSGFATMLGDSVASAQGKIINGEATALRGLVDQASLIDVATAVADAELTLRTVVGVRDRIINAYQEIIKMPI